MRRIPFTSAAAFLSVLFFISQLAAQAGDPESTVTRSPQADDAVDESAAPSEAEVHLNLIDQKLALSLAVDAQAQIDMAEFALKRIVNEPLRELVTTRLARQRAFAAELDRLTGGRAATALASARREIEDDRAQDKLETKRFRLLSIKSATAMLVRVRLEVQQEYAEMQRSELAAQSAEEFDKNYLRAEVLNRLQMLATLKVFEMQASEDFGRVIHETWSKEGDELVVAKQLLARLQAGPLVSSAPATRIPAKPVLVEAIVEP